MKNKQSVVINERKLRVLGACNHGIKLFAKIIRVSEKTRGADEITVEQAVENLLLMANSSKVADSNVRQSLDFMSSAKLMDKDSAVLYMKGRERITKGELYALEDYIQFCPFSLMIEALQEMDNKGHFDEAIEHKIVSIFFDDVVKFVSSDKSMTADQNKRYAKYFANILFHFCRNSVAKNWQKDERDKRIKDVLSWCQKSGMVEVFAATLIHNVPRISLASASELLSCISTNKHFRKIFLGDDTDGKKMSSFLDSFLIGFSYPIHRSENKEDAVVIDTLAKTWISLKVSACKSFLKPAAVQKYFSDQVEMFFSSCGFKLAIILQLSDICGIKSFKIKSESLLGAPEEGFVKNAFNSMVYNIPSDLDAKDKRGEIQDLWKMVEITDFSEKSANDLYQIALVRMNGFLARDIYDRCMTAKLPYPTIQNPEENYFWDEINVLLLQNIMRERNLFSFVDPAVAFGILRLVGVHVSANTGYYGMKTLCNMQSALSKLIAAIETSFADTGKEIDEKEVRKLQTLKASYKCFGNIKTLSENPLQMFIKKHSSKLKPISNKVLMSLVDNGDTDNLLMVMDSFGLSKRRLNVHGVLGNNSYHSLDKSSVSCLFLIWKYLCKENRFDEASEYKELLMLCFKRGGVGFIREMLAINRKMVVGWLAEWTNDNILDVTITFKDKNYYQASQLMTELLNEIKFKKFDLSLSSVVTVDDFDCVSKIVNNDPMSIAIICRNILNENFGKRYEAPTQECKQLATLLWRSRGKVLAEEQKVLLFQSCASKTNNVDLVLALDECIGANIAELSAKIWDNIETQLKHSYGNQSRGIMKMIIHYNHPVNWEVITVDSIRSGFERDGNRELHIYEFLERFFEFLAKNQSEKSALIKELYGKIILSEQFWMLKRVLELGIEPSEEVLQKACGSLGVGHNTVYDDFWEEETFASFAVNEFRQAGFDLAKVRLQLQEQEEKAD